MKCESNKTPTLYVVATPLGNLADITQRALDALHASDAIACEDTRHARTLLDHYGVKAPAFALHRHNEREAAEKVVQLLRLGKTIALISDAGTPGISDPGARVVATVQEAGFAVVPLPGPNAAVTALSACGLIDERFLFVGFLPAKPAPRRAELARWKDIPAALVFYEAPHRIAECVADIADALEPAREIIFARELTKRFEQIVRMPLSEACAWLAADDNHRRGEFVLIVSSPPPREGLDAQTERVLRLLSDALPTSQAARLAADITGASKNALYDRALELAGKKGESQ